MPSEVAWQDPSGDDTGRPQPHYLAAAKEPKAFWKIAEAGHTGGYTARPREYTKRLTTFFDETLLASVGKRTGAPGR